MADTQQAYQHTDVFSSIPPEILFVVFDKANHETRQITLRAFAVTCIRNAKISRMYLSERKMKPLESKLLLDAIAWNGMLGLLKYGAETISIRESTMVATIMGDSLKCLVFCHKKMGKWPCNPCELAAQWDRIQILKYAHRNGASMHESTLRAAAKRGSLECVRYYHEYIMATLEYRESDTHHLRCMSNIIDDAVESKNLDCIRYVLDSGAEVSSSTIKAVQNSTVDVMELFKSRGINVPLIRTKCDIDKHDCIKRHKYLSEHGIPWYSYSADDAASNGHIECLKFAHESGCGMVLSCRWAAVFGHLECLEYAHKNGGSVQSCIVEYAIIHNSVECFKYCLENGFPRPTRVVRKRDEDSEIYRMAEEAGIVVAVFDTDKIDRL